MQLSALTAASLAIVEVYQCCQSIQISSLLLAYKYISLSVIPIRLELQDHPD